MTDPEEIPFVGKVTQKALLFGPNDEILVTRVDDHWEPPGGTFEYGETLVGGLRRELREELDVESRIGPPVDAMYGGWIDGETYNPMVSLLYRCETDKRDVTLNDEHDEYEWVSPAEAGTRLGEMAPRLETAVERATALGSEEPFDAVTDPYASASFSTEAVLESLAETREMDPPDE